MNSSKTVIIACFLLSNTEPKFPQFTGEGGVWGGGCWQNCVVAAFQPSSITLHKTTVNVEIVSDGKVNLRPLLLTAARIKWQARYLRTDGAARLNSHICFRAVAAVELSVDCAARGVRDPSLFGAAVCQSAAKSLAFIWKWWPCCLQTPCWHFHYSSQWGLLLVFSYLRPHSSSRFCLMWSSGADFGVSYILFIALGLT